MSTAAKCPQRCLLLLGLLAALAAMSLAFGADAQAKSAKHGATKGASGCGGSDISLLSILSGAAQEEIPTELLSTLEAPVLSTFAVFRRAALPSDQIPALSPVGENLDSELASYYPAYVRELKALPSGERYYVVPGFRRLQDVPPARCLPPNLRAERPKLVEEAHKAASELVYCIAQVGGSNGLGGGGGCESFAEVEKSSRVFAGGLLRSSIMELVPDGVASVRITYAHLVPMLAPVSENAYLVTVPKSATTNAERFLARILKSEPKGKHLTKKQKAKQEAKALNTFINALAQVALASAPEKLEWLDSSGAVMRTIDRPKNDLAKLARAARLTAAG